MQNKISDLRNHLFAQLERISDETLKPEALALEIHRSEAIAELSHAVIDSARAENEYMSLLVKSGERLPSVTDFMKKID